MRGRMRWSVLRPLSPCIALYRPVSYALPGPPVTLPPMAAGKLSSAQQAQVAFLETIPPKVERITRLVEEMGALKADDTQVRNLARLLESLKNEAQSYSLGSLADSLGVMAMLARRGGGGLQMRVRGLREGLVSLRINYEGALRSATRVAEDDGETGPLDAEA